MRIQPEPVKAVIADNSSTTLSKKEGVPRVHDGYPVNKTNATDAHFKEKDDKEEEEEKAKKKKL